MKVKVYSIFDKELGVYGSLCSHQNDILARRSFEMIKTRMPDIQLNPSNFTLYQVGEFDDATGEIENLNPRVVFEFAGLFNNEK